MKNVLLALLCSLIAHVVMCRVQTRHIYTELHEYCNDEIFVESKTDDKEIFPVARFVYKLESTNLCSDHSSKDMLCVALTNNIPRQEYNALKDFYDSLSGDSWTWKNETLYGAPWNFTQGSNSDTYNNPCADDWQGISCICNTTTEFCNVQVIALNSYGLMGSIPDSIGEFPYLTQFDVGKNSISGTLPTSLGDLSLLSVFIVNLNHNIKGHIPVGLYNSLNMTYFDVSDNIMSGSISPLLGKWSNLVILYLDHNHFTNQIPDSIGNLTLVTNMELESNSFNGTIPSSLGNLKVLTMLLLFSNKLTGTIPKELNGLSSIYYFELYDNLLHGSIPPEICDCSTMEVMYLMKNKLSGSIPDRIGDLSNLYVLEAYTNQLTGSLPDSLYNLIHLQYLEFFSNHLSGTISENIGVMVNLSYFQMNYNQFNGPLPTSITLLKKMLIIDVSNNQMTGGVPLLIGNLQKLHIGLLSSLNHFVAYQNLFHGPIPPGLVDLLQLSYIDLHFNHFTGTIPEKFEQLKSMTYLCLYGNHLSGTIPWGISQLGKLQQLFINDNYLTGNLYNFFNVSVQKVLTNIDISVNLVTGSIPDTLFELPFLATLALGTNCLLSTLPDSMCNGRNITALALDGINNAVQCKHYLLPKAIRTADTYSLYSKVKSIPPCVFMMPKLETLHLSGNGITGTLASDLLIFDTLSDLTLSYNEIYGRIPDSIVHHVTDYNDGWINLDLSYNKLSGVIDGSFPSLSDYQQLSLQVNRLSGHITRNLLDAEHIDILDGNIFTCESTSDEGLPQHDPHVAIYECGSNSCNQAIYVWLSMTIAIGTTMLIVAIGFWNVQTLGKTAISNLSLWQQVMNHLYELAEYRKACMAMFDISFTPNQSQSIIQFGYLFSNIRKVFCVVSVVIVFILMPIYCVLTAYYNSYEHEYAWFLSAAFLSGQTPAIILLIALILFILVIIMVYDKYLFPLEYIHKERYDNAVGMKPVERSGHTVSSLFNGYRKIYVRFMKYVMRRRTRFRYNMFVFCMIILNCAVVFVVNGCYIYISITYDRTIVTVSQISFAIFKLFWNSVIVFDLFAKLKSTYFFEESRHATASYRASLISSNTHRGSRSTAKIEGRDILVQSFIVMFNNIASPCLAIAVISSNCFYNVFYQSPMIFTEYSFEYCINLLLPSGKCTSYVAETLSAKYYPPFSYSYICSSQFITTYTTVYIYMFIISSFVLPIITLLGKILHQHMRKELYEAKLLEKVLPNIVLPLKELERSGQEDSLSESPLISDLTNTNRDSLKLDFSFNSRNSDILKELDRTSNIGIKHTQDSLVQANSLKQLFYTSKYMVTIVCNLGILITFGALFPPLAVIICISTIIHTNYVQVLIGNVLVQACEAKSDGSLPYFHYSYRLDEECDGASKAFQSTIWLLLLFASSFYAFFIFDILGDDVGWKEALWGPLVMFLVPITIYILMRCVNRFLQFCSKCNVKEECVSGIEEGTGHMQDYNVVEKEDI